MPYWSSQKLLKGKWNECKGFPCRRTCFRLGFAIFVKHNTKNMTTRDPIFEFFEKATSYVPAEVDRMETKAFEEQINDAYSQFEDYVLSSLPFDFDIEEYREEEGMVAACSTPISVNQFADTLSQTAELLRTVSKKPSPVPLRFQVQSFKDTGALGNLDGRISIEDLPYDKLSKRQQEAVHACQELMNDTSRLLESIMDLIKEIDEELEEPLHEPLIGDDRSGLEPEIVLTTNVHASPIPFFFDETNYGENELRRICSSLIEWNWLDEETDEDDFVFFFSGEGLLPLQRLQWRNNNVRLSLLLSLLTQDKTVWKKASDIFKIRNKKYDGDDPDMEYLPVKANTLRVTYSYTMGSDKYLKKLDEVKRVIGLN